MTAATETRPVTITAAEHLRSVADWLEAEGIEREVTVSIVQIPWATNGKPTVVFNSMEDFRRRFAGRTAVVERRGASARYTVTLDGLIAECVEYHRDAPHPVSQVVL